jgi:hypothetical protein
MMTDVFSTGADLSIVNPIRSRVGRKRQDGPREKNGRLSRQILREIDGYAPAAVARFVEATLAGYQSREYGTPLGRLFLAGKISEQEFKAGRRWDQLIRLYHEALQAPAPDPRGIAIGQDTRSAKVDPSSNKGLQEATRHRAIIEAVNAAHAVIIGYGKLAERDMRRLCEGLGENPSGHESLLRAKTVLAGLAKFWQLSKSPR